MPKPDIPVLENDHPVMKVTTIFSTAPIGTPACHASHGYLAAALFVLIGIGSDLSVCRAQQPGSDAPGTEVLTRGPVHEAFAGMVTFNPEPGVVVTKAPPAVIEEMPPDMRPEGDNVTWIPGYWAWDDERNDFLWVSGTWRALPPGRAWIAGYWGPVSEGYQWTSGYWADAAARETTYLPAPPATVEAGPNIEAPSLDYGWTPGCWLWYQGRYAWSPGYWAPGRADWDWIPAHYVWTHRGYIFVGGFWDYSIERRGLLFAPIYFDSGVYARSGYFYSPTIVINLGVFDDYLFLRPRYNHYYFGDYYAANYYQGGFYASFSFQSGRFGYDPIFSHQRWEHRQDREWEHRVEASYQDRRDHESARPPRTWAAQGNINPGAAGSRPNRGLMATPIDQLARSKDSPLKFQPVAKAERQKLAQRGQEVQQARDQRRTLEAKTVDTSVRKPGAVFEPVKVQLPKSPIVAKSASQLGKNLAPPKVQQPSKPDTKFQPKPEPAGRQPAGSMSNPQSQPRAFDSELKPASGRSAAMPHEQKPIAVDTSMAPAPKNYEVRSQTRKFAPAAPELKPAARLRINPAPKVRQPTQSEAGNPVGTQTNPPRPAYQNLQPPVQNNPPANDSKESNPGAKDRENKGR